VPRTPKDVSATVVNFLACPKRSVCGPSEHVAYSSAGAGYRCYPRTPKDVSAAGSGNQWILGIFSVDFKQAWCLLKVLAAAGWFVFAFCAARTATVFVSAA
jgi:hypothetical protein